MGSEKESIEKRVSRIELDIDHMNQMIDENLKLNEAGDRLEQSAHVGEAQVDNKQQLNNGVNTKEELPREDSVQSSGTSEYSDMGNGGGSYDAPGTHSEISNDEYYGWSEDQQEEQSEQGYATGQSEADTEGENEENAEADPEETFEAPAENGAQETANSSGMFEQYSEPNDEWEDEGEDVELDNATPQIPHTATLPEPETPKPVDYETEPENQQYEQEPVPTDLHLQQEIDTDQNGYPLEDVQDSTGKVPNPPKGIEFLEAREDESFEYSYEPANQESENTHTRATEAEPEAELETEPENAPETAPEPVQNGNLNTIDATQSDAGQSVLSQNASGGKFRDSLYDMYDDHQELSQNRPQENDKGAFEQEPESEPPQARSSVGPYHIDPQQNGPFDYSYETFDTAPPHTAGTSQGSNDNNSFNMDKSSTSNRSTSDSTDIDDSIFIPKNNSQRPATTSNTPVASRRPTNPFRVVSVGVVGPDGRTSRKTSAGTFTGYKDPNTDGPAILQKKLDYLTKRCTKLQREIYYLAKMNSSSSLPIEDSRKLSRAISKLQEYLDRKNKEKYEVGVLLSRQLRREIDRGENGQFWIGTK